MPDTTQATKPLTPHEQAVIARFLSLTSPERLAHVRAAVRGAVGV